MLTARDFVKIDLDHPHQEVTRVTSLVSQIDAQPVALKRKLVREFLEIVEDSRERPSTRASACFMLAGQRKKLEITGSKAVTKQLRAVLVKEFLTSKRKGIFKRDLILNKVRQQRFPLLLGLLSTMLRIDFSDAREIVQSVASQVDDPIWKETFQKVLPTIAKELGIQGDV